MDFLRKRQALLLFAVTFLGSCRTNVGPVTRENTAGKVYSWLVAQQSETGLVGNQEGDDFSGLYVNALAALCYTHQGENERARRVFGFFQHHYREDFEGFNQFWNARTGEVYADSDRWIGDNAWLLIALNYYRGRTGDTQFDDMRAGIAAWLAGLQEADGGIRAGFNKSGPMNHKSTEGNLDCYAAQVEGRDRILEWLRTQMWVPGEQRLKMGSTVDESPLDATSWGVSALGRQWAILLPYTEQHFIRTDTCQANGKAVTGFADFLNKRRVWFEGTGQMVVAYNVAGLHEKAGRYLREMESVMLDSKLFPGMIGLPCASSEPPWKDGAEKIFVPSQAWYLFGRWKFNPMATAS